MVALSREVSMNTKISIRVLATMAWAIAATSTLRASVTRSSSDHPTGDHEPVIVAPRTVELAQSYLTSRDPTDRTRALAVLRTVRDPRHAQAAMKFIDDPDPAVRAQAILTLEAIVPSLELIPVLESK